ncbi:hypothetical protein Q5752_006204 [Cryptotrichosporon argae]
MPADALRVVTSQDPERADAPAPAAQPEREANAPPPAEQVMALRFAAHYSVLALAAMLGTLARLGLESLGTYDGHVIYQLAWAQGVGCGVMGLALARKNEITWLYPPLYTFFTTGIAGSITTFSSWMLEGYEAFLNLEKYDRKGLHDTVDGVAYSLSTFAIAYASLCFGEYLASVLPPLPRPPLSRRLDGAPKSSSPASSSTSRTPRRLSDAPWLDALSLASFVLAYLVALLVYFLAPRYYRHDAVFALLLSPPGAMLRFLLSQPNARPPFLDRFPLGTFAANMLATTLIAGAYAAQRRPAAHAAPLTCDALYAIQQGFCGCLSTVSTFVVESRTVRGWRCKAVYVVGSVILGHVLVLAIVGGTDWGEGFEPVCAGSLASQ